MCMQCVAGGSAYVVPALAGLKLWSSRRRRPVDGAGEPAAAGAADGQGPSPEEPAATPA